MLSYFKNLILKQKEKLLKRRFPEVKISLHADIPAVSINKVVQLAGRVEAINKLEPQMQQLSDQALREKTASLRAAVMEKAKLYQPEIEALEEAWLASALQEEKDKIKDHLKEKQNKIFTDILPEAFALVREAARRSIGMRHFDVQLVGGIILHEGKIAEMATGEGKTLVATLPAYLNALLGKGVHIVTVNDYLARRDREWMGPVYEFLGLSVGVIQHDMSDAERKRAYLCDITYGTNNEFGFDYLRDNMKYSLDDLVQRPFYYAIVDEVDSILVDEARTPLIISGPAEESTDKYYTINRVIPQLKGRIILEKDEIEAKYKGEDLSRGFDYIVDEKAHTAHLSESGEIKVCKILGVENLHEIQTMDWRHHIIQALRAHNLYQRDVDYVIKDGQVIIVDEFTGRMMPGRRWSDGLHQAIEAKEGLRIERENQTLATVTFQNYFRMYEKLAGMTGTAFTESNEFKAIYRLDVVVIPTNQTLIRTNYSDCVYKTEKEKFNAVVEEIAQLYQQGRPVLVGTISIDKSERLAELLRRRGIPHQVLNAKYHESEAQIVAQAGRYKAVTIATNMAGRGTDILLGGNAEYTVKNLLKEKIPLDDPFYPEEYKKLSARFKEETEKEHREVVVVGGLHVLGTERHEARRIDNQLRGRSGRQGDPGSSRFHVSFEDDLLRLFAPEWMLRLLEKIDTQGEPLTLREGQMAQMVSKSIAIAQHRVEQYNFEIRRQLLEYDNVMNKQREVIYQQRRQILEGVSLKEEIEEEINQAADFLVNRYMPPGADEDIPALIESLNLKYGVKLFVKPEGLSQGEVTEEIKQSILTIYAEKEKAFGSESLRHLERIIFLQIIDAKWKDHLYAMDNLREGIGLRAYGQRDPLVEYKREAFAMFQEMVAGIRDEAVELLFKVQLAKPQQLRGVFSSLGQQLLHPEAARFSAPVQTETPSPAAAIIPKEVNLPQPNNLPRVGRNDPCPCGAIDPATGKPIKYKKCHGR